MLLRSAPWTMAGEGDSASRLPASCRKARNRWKTCSLGDLPRMFRRRKAGTLSSSRSRTLSNPVVADLAHRAEQPRTEPERIGVLGGHVAVLPEPTRAMTASALRSLMRSNMLNEVPAAPAAISLTPSVRITQSGRIFGCAANGAGRPAPRARGPARWRRGLPSEIERHICAHCLRAAVSSVRSFAQPVGQAADLLVHGLVEQRLHLVGDVELDAGDGACRRRRARPGRTDWARSASSAAARARPSPTTLPRMSAR